MSGCVFVVGAGGRLGAAIVDGFGDRKVIAHTRATLDITDAAAVMRAVEAVAPAVIVNCAAFNRVDEAEDRPIDALAVNAFAVRSLARAAEAVNAVLVHYGSDFVFDGNATGHTPKRHGHRPAARRTEQAAWRLAGTRCAQRIRASRREPVRVYAGQRPRRGSSMRSSRHWNRAGLLRFSPIASYRRRTSMTSFARRGI